MKSSQTVKRGDWVRAKLKGRNFTKPLLVQIVHTPAGSIILDLFDPNSGQRIYGVISWIPCTDHKPAPELLSAANAELCDLIRPAA